MKEDQLMKWVCYNFMAIERGLLPDKFVVKFLELVNKNEQKFERIFISAMNILEFTNISDAKIKRVLTEQML